MPSTLESAYAGRSVFLTGHTGFKGSWLALWLQRLGAQVTGFGLAPEASPNHYELLGLEPQGLRSVLADLNDDERLRAALEDARPEIVLHLAAQPIVLRSYEDPLGTFETNVLGTARLLEHARHLESLKALVVVTSDKCYENRERREGYREDEPLGGHDPYSASKAGAEIVTASYRRSFFHGERGSQALVASARAGNVIGGGDWAADRLVPDVMRAAARGEPVRIRNPRSTRPWQHVLEPLSGYLALGAELLAGNRDAAAAWNFGPDPEAGITTEELFGRLQRTWSEIRCEIAPVENAPHEAGLLMLDSTKARQRLGWRPAWDLDATLAATARWYRAHHESGAVLSAEQVDAFTASARELGIAWAR